MSKCVKLSKTQQVALSHAANYGKGQIYLSLNLSTRKALIVRGLVEKVQDEYIGDWAGQPVLLDKFVVSAAGYQWLSENDSYFLARYEDWALDIYNEIVPFPVEVLPSRENSIEKSVYVPPFVPPVRVQQLAVINDLPDIVHWLERETAILEYHANIYPQEMSIALWEEYEDLQNKIRVYLDETSKELGY